MSKLIKLNPMQESYIHGINTKYGIFTKACYAYEYKKEM